MKSGLVKIADTEDEFLKAVEQIFAADERERAAWLRQVDEFLAGMSWDETWSRMSEKMADVATVRAVERSVPVKATAMTAGVSASLVL
jgi:hypothetical protein